MKLAIPPLVAKFTCFNLAVKFFTVDWLNSEEVIYLLSSGFLFSTGVVVANLIKLGISLASFILVFREASVTKFIISSTLSSMSSILTLYTSLLIISFYTSPSLLKSTGRGTNLSASSFSALLSKLIKLLGAIFNLTISNSSTSDSKLAKSVLLAKSSVSTSVAFLNLVLLHN